MKPILGQTGCAFNGMHEHPVVQSGLQMVLGVWIDRTNSMIMSQKYCLCTAVEAVGVPYVVRSTVWSFAFDRYSLTPSLTYLQS